MEGAAVKNKKNETKETDRLLGVVSSIKNKITSSQDNNGDLIKMLREAHREWENAETYFQNVTEPDLIDYAIFKMEAARKKYTYLLKQVRKEEVKIEV